tara:strand:+ start:411 stop:575 length:165 start_codon:yes stop_codon:yes gene_type:complete
MVLNLNKSGGINMLGKNNKYIEVDMALWLGVKFKNNLKIYLNINILGLQQITTL